MTTFSARRLGAAEMKAFGIFLFCLIVIICGIIWLGYSTCNEPPKPTSKSEQTTDTDKYDCTTTNAAFKVGLYRTWVFVHDYKEEVVAISTVFIAIFTIILGVFTVNLAGATQTTAVAAKETADSLIAAERARFFIIIDRHNLPEIVKLVEDHGVSENSGLPGGDNILIAYCFKNYGKTPGIVRELIVDSMIAADPIDPPALFLSTKDFPEYMIGASDSTKAVNYSPVTHPSISQAQSIGRNARRLWFFGRLYYDDVFGKHQVHRFYFRSKSPLGGGPVVLEPFEYKDCNQST
jgi:hypothetical protein